MLEYFKTVLWLFTIGFILALAYSSLIMNGEVYQEIQEMYFDDAGNEETKRIA